MRTRKQKSNIQSLVDGYEAQIHNLTHNYETKLKKLENDSVRKTQILETRIFDIENNYKTGIENLENQLNSLKNSAIDNFRSQWCAEVISSYFKSEIEVEIKFVYLLMKFLGYKDNELKTRVSVTVPIGRQRVAGIADWVVYNQSNKPIMVIEAKEPNQELDNEVQEQARSYAFALKAPLYMLTNGKSIIIFDRKINEDEEVLNLKVSDLSKHWKTLEQIAGKTALSNID